MKYTYATKAAAPSDGLPLLQSRSNAHRATIATVALRGSRGRHGRRRHRRRRRVDQHVHAISLVLRNVERDRGQALLAPAHENPASLRCLAFAMVALRRLHAKHFKFVLPAASDNTSAETGINKLFTTTQPLCHFFKLVASWSARNHVQLAISHVAGEKNTWADKLTQQADPLPESPAWPRTHLTASSFEPARPCHPAPAARWLDGRAPANTASRMKKSCAAFRNLGLFVLVRAASLTLFAARYARL